MNTLEIGKDYATIFGVEEQGSMIFNGGISWILTKLDGSSMEMDSEEMTEDAIKYINRPTVKMGSLR